MPVLQGTWSLCCAMPSRRPSSSVEGRLLASVTPLHPCRATWTLVPATLITSLLRHVISALVDSGADGNFMAASLVAELHLTLTRLQMPLLAKALNGLQLAQMTHVTFPVSLLISGNHQETIVSHILDSPEVPIVLGHPWLVKHNPHIDWSNHNILGWRCPCL